MKLRNSPSSESQGLSRRVFQSIFPYPIIPKTDQERKRYLIKNLVLHLRPPTVPEKTLKFTLTWGLGGMAAVLVLLQIGTGIMLKFAYEPTPMAAYASIQTMQHNVVFGQLIRNIHHWCANLLVLIVFLHMLRVFFTGAFHLSRQFNWIIGLGLFSFVLIANFTGYLLPYDQLAYWAVTVSTGMLEYIPGIGIYLQETVRGGSDIGRATLRIFFAIHTAIVPVGLIILMAFHFWRIRRAGGLVVPRAPAEEIEEKPILVPTLPNLLLRETVVTLVLIAVVLTLSIFLNAPLGDPANPGLSPNPTKAPWYFMGFQEILLHFHPLTALFFIPVLMFIGLVSIPYIHYPSNTAGIWFASSKGRRMALEAAFAALIVTPIGILVDKYMVDFTEWMPGLSPAISNGLIPVGIGLSGFYGFHLLLKRRYSANRNESIQMAFVFFLTIFIILTMTGIWFRGSGMALSWP
ncbi:MAG: cytochrome b N-terminal domain-containing protein [Deltaproteobacteria bacterium]|nr:cytochrome b N-terminal domain-containing protein [Deltaproteobacteria bacterium]